MKAIEDIKLSMVSQLNEIFLKYPVDRRDNVIMDISHKLSPTHSMQHVWKRILQSILMHGELPLINPLIDVIELLMKIAIEMGCDVTVSLSDQT